MNTSIPRTSVSVDNAKHGNSQSEMNREQTRTALMSLAAMIMCIALLFAPHYLPSRVMGIVLAVVPAIYMTCFLYRSPDSLSDGRGSLLIAKCLVAFLWIVAFASVVAILSGI